MGTLLRVGAWRIMVYTHDHRPAHVHAVSSGGRAKILLNCPDGPVVASDARGMDAKTLRQLLIEIENHRHFLCSSWSRQHGDF